MRLIRLKEVIAKTGLSRSSIYSYISEKKFPANVPLGDRATAWVESEVDEWLKVQKVERSLLKTMECTEELLNKVFCSA
ncbi:AlpA family phage regulatory protein [Vibrio coralliilyticus]|uniref:AlpA family phage regulatory protein n=1 Tax=Vibrio coralliilyticus TaxID=190893 RepID=UPI002FD56D2B